MLCPKGSDWNGCRTHEGSCNPILMLPCRNPALHTVFVLRSRGTVFPSSSKAESTAHVVKPILIPQPCNYCSALVSIESSFGHIHKIFMKIHRVPGPTSIPCLKERAILYHFTQFVRSCITWGPDMTQAPLQTPTTISISQLYARQSCCRRYKCLRGSLLKTLQYYCRRP